jgi:hypothetical protein
MRIPILSLRAAAALGAFVPAAAQTEAASYCSVPGVDAPELAQRGDYGVGVHTL